MNGADWIRKQQRSRWDARSCGTVHRLDKQGRVPSVTENLFEPLSSEAEEEFSQADGDELRPGGKMCSLHSSSALCVNVFHHLRRKRLFDPLAAALGISPAVESLKFEQRFAITNGPARRRFPKPANLDVLLSYPHGHTPAAIGIESKFAEPYSAGHPGLSPTYLKVAGLWDGMPCCRKLAERISPDNRAYRHLDAAQLLKHTLAIRCEFGLAEFGLLYLWFQPPTPDGSAHSEEIAAFAEVLDSDGIRFLSATYNDLIQDLVGLLGEEHREYLGYVTRRYL